MPRVKRGVTARARHKKILALAKGYRGRRGNVYRIGGMLARNEPDEDDDLLSRLGAGPATVAYDELVEGTLDKLAKHLATFIDLDRLLSVAR